MKLGHIEVRDKSDLIAVKRANNTMAARKSRQKQIDYLESLEEEREELRAECNHWKNWATSVEEQYGFIFPTWLAANTIPAKTSPTQVPPTQVTTMHQASTQQLTMRALLSEAMSKETTMEQTRRD
jgi:Basic region leucine zipper